MPVPEPGLGKDVKPATPTVTRRPRPRAVASNVTKVSPAAPPAPARPSVEVIEGSKKKNVDFP
jgi:hypothetical protein